MEASELLSRTRGTFKSRCQCPIAEIRLSSKQKHYARHESELTPAEKGEEDVGLETELGDMEEIKVYPAQKR